jgi:hypothetical protein
MNLPLCRKGCAFLMVAFFGSFVNAQFMSPFNIAGETQSRAIGQYAEMTGAGSGQVWDYSSAVPQQLFTHAYSSMASSLFGKTFPDATWILDEEGTQLFYESSDSLYYHGGVQQGLVVFYENPNVSMAYPFDLGDSLYDEFTASYEVDQLTILRMGSTSAACLGTGSLTLPNGQQFPEAYQIHVIETLMDSTSLGNYYATIEGDHLFVSDWPMPVYSSVLYTVENQINGTPEQTTPFTSWLHNVVTGVDGVNDAADFAIHPNPARAGEACTVIWATPPAAYRLTDVEGRVVREERVAFGSPYSALNTQGMNAGVYFLSTDGNQPAQRLVIE